MAARPDRDGHVTVGGSDMFVNAFVAALLRSRLHGLLSGSVMLVTLLGRRTGRVLAFPVNYVRDGNALWTVSMPGRVWWRNLREGAQVTLRIAGRDLLARGTALTEPQDVAAGLARLVAVRPSLRRTLGVPNEQSDSSDADAFRVAGSKRIVIRFDPVAGDTP